jgi:hypothetical protein
VHMSENPPCPSGVGTSESSGELALDSARSRRTFSIPSLMGLHAMHDVFDRGLIRVYVKQARNCRCVGVQH